MGVPMMPPGRAPPMGMPPQAGMVRSADQMMEGTGEDAPPAKRQKIAKLPGGGYYPEADWISMHPVSTFPPPESRCHMCLTEIMQHPVDLMIQMPNDPSKPEWKLDGSVVTLHDLPLNLLVSSLRDRILQQTGSTVSTSRIRLSYAGKMLTNANTIASYNLEHEDVLVLSVRDLKKK